MEEQNQRLTSGLSAVYPRFIRGTRSALYSWLLTSGLTLFCIGKAFSWKAFRKYKELVFPGRTVLLASSPARPRPAAPPGALTRLARGMSRFWIRQLHARRIPGYPNRRRLF